MPVGPGKYDKQMMKALKDCKANQGILIVLDGSVGSSFCCRLSHASSLKMPALLRHIANDIEKEHKKGNL